ncbi:MAG: hypothetical protein AB4057_13035 [Crocosphaera sp.]
MDNGQWIMINLSLIIRCPFLFYCYSTTHYGSETDKITKPCKVGSASAYSEIF